MTTSKLGWVSRAAMGFGGFFVLAGALHLFAIAGYWVKRGVPEGRHAVYLLLVGYVQLASGVLNWMGGRRMGRGEAGGEDVSLVACFLLSAYALTQLVLLKETPLRVLMAVYALAHVGLALALLSRKQSR